MTITKIENRSISSCESLLSALKKMDEQKVKMLFAFEQDLFISILTRGEMEGDNVKKSARETPV